MIQDMHTTNMQQDMEMAKFTTLFSTRLWICNRHKTVTKSYLIVGMQAVVSVLHNSLLPNLFIGFLINFISWHLNLMV